MFQSSMHLVINTFLALFLSLISQARLSATDEAVQSVGKFAGDSYVEIEQSQQLLDLNRDFTIEMWVSWQPSGRKEYFAGDEAWPSMSSQIQVEHECGWVLRKLARKDYEVLDFTFGCKESRWVSVKGEFQKTTEAVHLVVSRYRDVISVIANGQVVAQKDVKGLTILPAPTPIYVGPRKHGHQRTFQGTIGFFRLANAAYSRAVPFEPQLIEGPAENDLVFYDFRKIEDGKLIDLATVSRNGLGNTANHGMCHKVQFVQQ